MNKNEHYSLEIYDRHTNSKHQQPCRRIFQLEESQELHKRMIHRKFRGKACSLLEIVWRSQSLQKSKSIHSIKSNLVPAKQIANSKQID